LLLRHFNHTGNVDEASGNEASASSKDITYVEGNRVPKHIFSESEKDQDHWTTLKQQPSNRDTNEVEGNALKQIQSMLGFGLFAGELGFHESEIGNSYMSHQPLYCLPL
jgi:hypothetical protein